MQWVFFWGGGCFCCFSKYETEIAEQYFLSETYNGIFFIRKITKKSPLTNNIK